MHNDPVLRLFGTDGIRDIAFEGRLAAETLNRLGFAMAQYLQKGRLSSVVIGRDTRESGMEIQQILLTALQAGGIHTRCAGILPTPSLAYLVQKWRMGLGIVISASHNPAEYNGIKLFMHDGFKAPKALEKELESLAAEVPCKPVAIPEKPCLSEEAGARIYTEDLLAGQNGLSLKGMKMVLDCAHGAASSMGPKIFRTLGAEVTVLFAEPDGRNINKRSGALYPEYMAAEVVRTGAHMGISLDGDGDRVIMADEKGRIINGDIVLAMLAIEMAKQDRLVDRVLVATVMSNIGLEVAMQSNEIQLVRTDVGDRNVVREMQQRGATLGGEQSGHIILAAHSTTGDGIRTALGILEIMTDKHEALSSLAACMQTFPQILQNIKVTDKPDLMSLPGVAPAIKTAQDRLGAKGRVLVRYSGTEPLARVMIEGPDQAEIEHLANTISQAIQASIGENKTS